MIRKIVLLSLILGSSLLFIFQLMALQLFNSDYTERSLNNAIQKRPIYPTRGLIYDRNGVLWVANKPVYDLMVVPENLTSFDTLELISKLDFSKEELVTKLMSLEFNRLHAYYQKQSSNISKVESDKKPSKKSVDARYTINIGSRDDYDWKHLKSFLVDFLSLQTEFMQAFWVTY